MPSIKEVAEQAAVSTMTVSRVLSDPDAVSPALRARVQQAIDALGYRPNLAARRLRQRRASLIGLIVSDIRNPFFTDVSRAVEDLAYRNGLRLMLCNADEDPAKESAYLELMADEQASGVILSPTSDLLGRFRAAQWPYPVVMLDRALDTTPADVVLLDNEAAAQRLTRSLIASGHRRIAAITGTSSTTARARRAGIEAALREAGLEAQIRSAAPGVEAGSAAMRELLRTGERPDALIATNGLLMLGALRAIQQAGLQVPRDIKLAGFDANDWNTLPQLGITLIAQPTYEIGRTAVELLLQRLADPTRQPRRVVLEGELIEGLPAALSAGGGMQTADRA